MPLRILRSSDPLRIEHIVLTIYGPPGVQKTTTLQSARNPLTLDFDGGIHRARYRRDAVRVNTWADVVDMKLEELSDYSTIGVDTAGRALDAMANAIMARDSKMKQGDGSLSLKGFGALKSGFTTWLNLLKSSGKDVVLILHSDEKQNGDDLIERIDAQGSSKNEIYKSSDAMARLAVRNGKLVLLFSPTDTAFGKNPAGLPPIEVPTMQPGSEFLAEIIDKIKVRLNEMTAEQSEVATALTEWNAKVVAATTADALTKLVKDADNVDSRAREAAKKTLWSHAKTHGFEWKSDRFIERPAEAVA